MPPPRGGRVWTSPQDVLRSAALTRSYVRSPTVGLAPCTVANKAAVRTAYVAPHEGIPMKRLVVAFATAALAASLPLSTGCAAEEAEAREAAYPEAIGYTPVQSSSFGAARGLSVGAAPGSSFGAPPPNGLAPGANGSVPPAPPPYGAEVDVAASEPGSVPPGSGQEVVVGEASDGDVYPDADPSALTDFPATLDPSGTSAR